MSWRTREITYIAFSAALWSVFNALLSPWFFAITRMPFLCDSLGVLALMVACWKVRKIGACSTVGLISTIITLSINPNMVQFIGFGFACIMFDLISYLIGYSYLFDQFNSILLIIPSIAMAFVAGLTIATLFMGNRNFEFIMYWGSLHALGGIIGGAIGIFTLSALKKRMMPFSHSN